MKGRTSINNNDNNKIGIPSLTDPSTSDDYEVIDAEDGEVEEGHRDVIEEEKEQEQEKKHRLLSMTRFGDICWNCANIPCLQKKKNKS